MLNPLEMPAIKHYRSPHITKKMPAPANTPGMIFSFDMAILNIKLKWKI